VAGHERLDPAVPDRLSLLRTAALRAGEEIGWGGCGGRCRLLSVAELLGEDR
jgi:hypothetical protein